MMDWPTFRDVKQPRTHDKITGTSEVGNNEDSQLICTQPYEIEEKGGGARQGFL